ncbi:MAG: hypothetical protein WD969_14825 [Paracoccaceae bacterium]
MAFALLVGGCAIAPGAPESWPNSWDISGQRAALDAGAGDPWCGYMADIRAHLDGAGPAPGEDARAAALEAVRAEAVASKDGDPLWPFRKALICEYLQGAEEEAQVFEWVTVAQFQDAAGLAAGTPAPEDGVSPLVPVFDHLSGAEPESIAPVDLSTPEYCDTFETATLALSQQRGGIVGALGFPGSLRRAPDWYAHIQVSYHRWGREAQERRRLAADRFALGDAPRYCRRLHAALERAAEFELKDNLIFLLPELDDPEKSGRLVVRDAAGHEVVLDRVLAAAQLGVGGEGGEAVDFFAEDLAAAPGLKGAVDRTNNLPPPKVFSIHFDYNRREPIADDPQIGALKAELASRSPEEPLRFVLSGHADCAGPRWYNTMISEDRVKSVFEGIIRPALLMRGFPEAALADKKRFKLVGLGEGAPAVKSGPRCEATDENRRVVVVVQ